MDLILHVLVLFSVNYLAPQSNNRNHNTLVQGYLLYKLDWTNRVEPGFCFSFIPANGRPDDGKHYLDVDSRSLFYQQYFAFCFFTRFGNSRSFDSSVEAVSDLYQLFSGISLQSSFIFRIANLWNITPFSLYNKLLLPKRILVYKRPTEYRIYPFYWKR